MMEEIKDILEIIEDSMNQSITHLEKELVKIRAGKATPSMVNGVMVEYYGSMTPLSQVANVNTMDARTITIQPWEKSSLEPIERAIINSNLGLNPQNNGESILINVPILTEERRKELVKQAKAAAEHAKVGVRNARKEGNDMIKDLEKDGLSEDRAKDATNEVQKLTDAYSLKIDKIVAAKEEDIMTV